MRLFDMQIFLWVLEAGSLSGAARVASLTQPTVSNIIHVLEEEVGVQLLTRKVGQRSPVTATDEGRIFEDYARKVLRDYKSMKLTLAALGGESLSLSVITSPTPGTSVLPSLINSFRSEHPEVQVTSCTEVALLDNMYPVMQEGGFDLGVVPFKTGDKHLLFEPFFYDPIVLVCPATMDLPATISVRELRKLPLVARPVTSKVSRLVSHSLSKLHVDYSLFNISMQVNGDADVFRAVAMGSGVGFVTRSLYEFSHSDKRVKLLGVKGLTIDRYLYLVHRRNVPMTTALETFRDYALGTIWRDCFGDNTLPVSWQVEATEQ